MIIGCKTPEYLALKALNQSQNIERIVSKEDALRLFDFYGSKPPIFQWHVLIAVSKSNGRPNWFSKYFWTKKDALTFVDMAREVGAIIHEVIEKMDENDYPCGKYDLVGNKIK